jgi:RHS repeat-associated protein
LPARDRELFARTESLEWRVPEAPASGPIPAVLFDKKLATRFESWESATSNIGDRFPGGQTALFQGLWTDPVTGMAYARARWYDARNATWLSEDPLADVDSPNLYAFVGWQPSMATDPRGLCSLWETATNEAHCGEYFSESFGEEWDKDKEAVSTAVSFLPGVGDVKDWQEAVTGTDLITGRKLSNLERGITVAAAFIPIVGGSVLRNMFGESAEHLAKEGAEVLEEEAEQGLKRAGHLAEEEAEQGIKRAGHLAEEETEKSLRRTGDLAEEGAESGARRGSDALDEAAAGCRYTCFAEGTLVSTPNGEVPIEQIAVGDQVYSYDEETGEEHPAEVVALHHRDVTELWLLQVGGETIETTDEHPFYVVGQGWTRAKDLREGDVLIATSGNRLPLEKVDRVEQTARVYNFEVRDLHTYLVGRVGAVVHNCGPVDPADRQTATLSEWLKDEPELLDEARDAYQRTPEWQGINPDATEVFYRTKDEVDEIRKLPGESGGHHPHGLALGGPKGQTLTPTGDTRHWKNPDHVKATRLQTRILRIMKRMMNGGAL